MNCCHFVSIIISGFLCFFNWHDHAKIWMYSVLFRCCCVESLFWLINEGGCPLRSTQRESLPAGPCCEALLLWSRHIPVVQPMVFPSPRAGQVERLHSAKAQLANYIITEEGKKSGRENWSEVENARVFLRSVRIRIVRDWTWRRGRVWRFRSNNTMAPEKWMEAPALFSPVSLLPPPFLPPTLLMCFSLFCKHYTSVPREKKSP